MIEKGRDRFPDSPYFPYFDACLLVYERNSSNAFRIRGQLVAAREKCKNLPAEEAQVLLEQISEQEAMIEDFSPFFDMGSFFGSMPFDEDDFDED